jgi:hypothetical protein
MTQRIADVPENSAFTEGAITERVQRTDSIALMYVPLVTILV